jgi:hypothetical protein
MFSSKLFIHRLGDASVLYLNYGRLDMLSHREYRFEHVNADNPILCCSRQSVLIGFSYATTRPKIIGPERNVNLICNFSLYTHISNIKSISQSIAKKSGDNCFISELRTWVTLYVPTT